MSGIVSLHPGPSFPTQILALAFVYSLGLERLVVKKLIKVRESDDGDLIVDAMHDALPDIGNLPKIFRGRRVLVEQHG